MLKCYKNLLIILPNLPGIKIGQKNQPVGNSGQKCANGPPCLTFDFVRRKNMKKWEAWLKLPLVLDSNLLAELQQIKTRTEKKKQDGRLAPAYVSPNYKYFDQLLQTVQNKTTVLILVFKEFLQTSIRPLISVLYAKGYHDFPLKNFCLTVPKNFVEEPFCVSENFWYRKRLGIGEGAGIKIFCQTYFVSQYRKTS